MLTVGAEVVLALPDSQYLKGLAVSWDDQELTVAAPVAAAPGGRVYPCRVADGRLTNIVFVTGSLSALVADVAALAPESILGFAEPLDPQSVIRLYYVEHSSSDGSPAPAASRPSASTATPPALMPMVNGALASPPGLLPAETVLFEMRDMMRGLQTEVAQQRRTIEELQHRGGGRRPAASSARPATRGRTWDELLGPEETGDEASDDEVSFGGSGPVGPTLNARFAAPPVAAGPSASPWYLRGAAAPTFGTNAPAVARPAGLSDFVELLKELRLNRNGVDGESGDEHAGVLSRGLDGVRRMRKEVYANPEKIVTKYVEHMRTHLGITDTRQFWKVRDWVMKQNSRFARMRGMFRVYAMLGDILDHALHDRHQVAAALTVQAMKSMLQMALDDGAWDNAKLLWPESDPYEVAEFGGLEQEMAHVHRYRKAVSDLKTKVKQTPLPTQPSTPAADAEEATGQPERKKTGRGRGRGRNRDTAQES